MAFHYNKQEHYVRLILLVTFILSSICLDFIINRISPITFSFFILGCFFIYPSKNTFSPKNIVLTYYFLWFSFPVFYATRYEDYDFSDSAVFMSYHFIKLTFSFAYLGLSMFRENNKVVLSFDLVSETNLKRIIIVFSTLVFIFLILFVYKSGGIYQWLVNPGDAFLNRGGSGVLFLPFILALTANSYFLGLYSKKVSKKKIIVLNVLIVLLLSPFIGSKSRMLILVFLSVLPYVGYQKTKFKHVFFSILAFLLFFLLGLYFRNSSWLSFSDLLPYALNYFDTFDSLVVGVRDFDADVMKTIFLPFNKFSTIVGSDSPVFYDMSSWLTSIYYPWIYEMRATVQWPIEMDMYLSFYFYGLLPLIFIVFYFLSVIYNKALSDKTGAYMFVYGYLFFYTLSHLRGGIFLWTDFYIYPFLFLVFTLLKLNRIKIK